MPLDSAFRYTISVSGYSMMLTVNTHDLRCRCPSVPRCVASSI